MAKSKKLSDETVLSLVERKAKETVGFYDSKLSEERTKVQRYYNSTYPKQANRGSSSYVSSDVFDSVEAMKSQILETFSGNGDEIIKFPPLHEQDVEDARVATEYCSYVVFRENDGPGVFADALHDGLTARVGISKVYWDTDIEYEERKFKGISYDEVMGLSAQEDVAELDAEMDEATGKFSGTLEVSHDRSKVRLDAIPPEEFRISARAKTIKSADIVEHVTPKTRAELKDMYPDSAADIDKMGQDGKRSTDTQEELERNIAVQSVVGRDDDGIQHDLDKIDLHEAYLKLDIGKGVRLYRVCYAGHVLFEKQSIDRKPFFAFTPLPIPHVFFGNNFASRVVPTQNARTVLTRGVLDHTAITVNPRWQVVKGGLLNPKEMLDNRLGGLVNVRSEGAIQPLAYANLNPFVFQVLEMLKANKEESTGISSLSQGLNKDAISQQNSQGLVGDLVQLSQTRQKIVARNFAKYLADIYLEVYRLVLENEKKDKIIEVAGSFTPVNVENWVQRRNVKVAMHLGYGEKDREAAKYSSTYMMLSKDPGLAPMFGPKKKYEMVTDGMKLAGFPKTYLDDPSTVEPPKPDPLKMRELDIKEIAANAAMITAQATAGWKNAEAQLIAMTKRLDNMNFQMDSTFKARESDRMDIETSNRVDVSQREMKLAEEAPKDGEKVSAIVSPNG